MRVVDNNSIFGQYIIKTSEMKKFIAIVAFLISATSLFAQYYEITPLAGYTFSGEADNGYGTYDIENAFLYGGRLDVQITDFSYVGLSYRRNDPTVSFLDASDQSTSDHKTGTAHYMVGFLHEFGDKKVKPFGLISAGTSRYWTKSATDYRQWFFSTEFGLGAKIFINENLGLRLQAAVTTPWDFAGGGMYWGVGTGGGGGSANLTFGIPVAHWDLSAGIIIRMRD
jgi:hypothetical protein